jgi:hypothetical protein
MVSRAWRSPIGLLDILVKISGMPDNSSIFLMQLIDIPAL